MKNISSLLKKPLVKGDVGIEIECEGFDLTPVHNEYWNTEHDGSLRGIYPQECCEYVSNGPVLEKDIVLALEDLFKRQKYATFHFSIRTSVHVHVNVGLLTSDQVFAMIYAYLLYEHVLMNYCGKTRQGNRFCLRMEDADNVINHLCKLVGYSQVQLTMAAPRDAIRYSAVNIEALWKYGSVEFRGLEGTNDIPRIHLWTQMLLALRKYAVSVSDIRDVFNDYLRNGCEGLFDKIFPMGKTFKYPGWEADVANNFSISMEIPYAYKEHLHEEEEKPKEENLFIEKDVDKRDAVEINRNIRFNINPEDFNVVRNFVPGANLIRNQFVNEDI